MWGWSLPASGKCSFVISELLREKVLILFAIELRQDFGIPCLGLVGFEKYCCEGNTPFIILYIFEVEFFILFTFDLSGSTET